MGWNINENTVSVGGCFDGVLLDGDEIADALFRPRVTVCRVRFVRLRDQVVACVLVSRERADHLGVFEGGDVLAQAGGEGGGGVAEEADDELVTDLEARQGTAQLAQGVHRLRGGETVGSAGCGQHGLAVCVDAVGAQCVGQFGGKDRASSQGDEDVVVASHEAHRAQQGGDGDRVHAAAPRGGADAQVDGAGAVRGRTLLGAGDECSRPIEGATEGDGFADEQAQADGVFRVQLGEASGVCAGEGQRRQRRPVGGDVTVEARAPLIARLSHEGGRVRRGRRGRGGLGLRGGTSRKDTRNHVLTLRQHRPLM